MSGAIDVKIYLRLSVKYSKGLEIPASLLIRDREKLIKVIYNIPEGKTLL